MFPRCRGSPTPVLRLDSPICREAGRAGPCSRQPCLPVPAPKTPARPTAHPRPWAEPLTCSPPPPSPRHLPEPRSARTGRTGQRFRKGNRPGPAAVRPRGWAAGPAPRGRYLSSALPGGGGLPPCSPRQAGLLPRRFQRRTARGWLERAGEGGGGGWRSQAQPAGPRPDSPAAGEALPRRRGVRRGAAGPGGSEARDRRGRPQGARPAAPAPLTAGSTGAGAGRVALGHGTGGSGGAKGSGRGGAGRAPRRGRTGKRKDSEGARGPGGVRRCRLGGASPALGSRDRPGQPQGTGGTLRGPTRAQPEMWRGKTHACKKRRAAAAPRPCLAQSARGAQKPSCQLARSRPARHAAATCTHCLRNRLPPQVLQPQTWPLCQSLQVPPCPAQSPKG